MTRYSVTAKRWELHIDGIGVTQSATLASALTRHNHSSQVTR